MNHKQTRAIVLKRINFGEADKILTVLTPDYGKVSMLAKGVRKSKSKLAGGLELFSVTEIGFIDGKSQIKTIVSTRLEKFYGQITDDISCTMIGYEFLKLIDSYTEESCDEEYFELLNEGLHSLTKENRELTELWFLVRLLSIAGHTIHVEEQINGESFVEHSQYEFSFDDMGFYEKQNGPFQPKHIKFLRLLEKITKPENILKVQGAVQFEKDLRPVVLGCSNMFKKHSY